MTDKGLLWLARDSNGILTDSDGEMKLICPFCSGEVTMQPDSGFIHQFSACSVNPTALEKRQMQLVAEEMLIAGDNLYVRPVSRDGKLLAPDKINTRMGTNFQRNTDINGHKADLSWISSKGFMMGVIFNSHLQSDAQASIVENCFAVVIDTASLVDRFRKQPQHPRKNVLFWARQSLSEAGDHSKWLLVAFPAHRTTHELPPLDVYQQETSHQWQMPEHGEIHSRTHVKNVMAKLLQRFEDPVTKEIVCLCTVKMNGSEHDFQVAQYAGQQILMSNVGESLPKCYPDYELILNACLKAERRCRIKDRQYS